MNQHCLEQLYWSATLSEVIRLQDLSNLIASIAALMGAVSAFYQVIMKNKRNPPSDEKELDEAKKEIEDLKSELKGKNKDEN